MDPELFPIWSPWFVALKAVVAIIKAPADARDCVGKELLQVSQLNERNERPASGQIGLVRIRMALKPKEG